MATPTNLPASFTVGQVATSAQMNDLRGAFRILQVVQGTTSTLVSNSTTTLADTGLTATITPQATSSKILVFVNHTLCGKSGLSTANGLNVSLFRGATNIKALSDALGYTNTAIDNLFSLSAVVFDSPNTTSATTYKTRFRNFSASASVSVQTQSIESSITLLEVSA
jgi:hypothetical protein